nr:immunoglobulin heavy chain junction region [Mus musculus]
CARWVGYYYGSSGPALDYW